MDVAEWLRGLGLERYVPAFRDNDIDGEVLRRLTAEDLRELGIASIGHRRRLLDAIAALSEGQHTAEAKPVSAVDSTRLTSRSFDEARRSAVFYGGNTSGTERWFSVQTGPVYGTHYGTN